MWSFKEKETHRQRYYKEYHQKYPWLWELIDRFRWGTPERFVITREQYQVLLEEPCLHAGNTARSPYKFARGRPDVEWVAKTNLDVPIYIEGYAPPKQLEIDFFAPPKQLKLVW